MSAGSCSRPSRSTGSSARISSSSTDRSSCSEPARRLRRRPQRESARRSTD
jgi:hypothetical protein